jgi:hypothetical protein
MDIMRTKTCLGNYLGIKQQAKNAQSWPQVFSTLTRIVKLA